MPHHLIDVLEPHQEYSLAQYLDAAGQAAADIRGRGRAVLFVGGTPLYLKGLLRGIFQGPAADGELRRRLEEEARRLGPASLHRRLAEVDPEAAGRLHPNDTRRLVRAIEVFEKTGQPISQLAAAIRDRPAGRAMPRLRARLAAGGTGRPHRPPRRGDVFRRPGRGGARAAGRAAPLSKTARQAVGYREVIEHLEGRRALPETIALVKLHTRQLAKRQGTWFRSLSECRLLPVGEPIDAVAAAQQMAAFGR